MKRDALNHPKMLDLSSRLDVCRAHAVGIMGLLFDFTATFAAQGDIGKFSNGAIARACDWNGNQDEFMASLVASGWIDKSENYRLRVHDWPEHCEQWVKLKLQKQGLTFLSEYSAQNSQSAITAKPPPAEPIAEASAEVTAEPIAEASASRDLAKPSLALTKTSPNPNPNVAKSREEGECDADASGPLPRKILDKWNSIMGQSCQMTKKRIAALKLRLVNHDWVKQWEAALQKCFESDFCRGVNDRAWVADFEWFIKPDTVIKLLEGKYDNRSKQGYHSTAAQKRMENTQRAIKEFVNGPE